MTGPRETLARIRKQADAATDGPWEADGLEGVITSKAGMPTSDPQKPRLVVDGITMWAESDAEFIAASRTNVPTLVDALEAVLDLHERAQITATSYGNQAGLDYCRDCFEDWPCPTVAPIIAALEGETDA